MDDCDQTSQEFIMTVHIGVVIACFLLSTSRVPKAIEIFQECLIVLNNKALKKQKNLVRRVQKFVYKKMFHGYTLIGDHTSVIKCAKKILALHSQCGEREEEGEMIFYLAKMYQHQCKYQKAEEYYMQALCIMKETERRQEERACNVALGNIYYFFSDFFKAEEYLEKALVISKEIGDRNGEAECYGNLGAVFESVGDYLKAEEYVKQALVINKEIGDRNEEAACYLNLGAVFQYVGEYVKAEEYLEKALAISKEIVDRNGEALCCGILGIVFHHVGEYVKADEYLEKALVINKEIGNRKGEAACNGNLGAVFHSVGEYVKAEEYLEKELVITKEIGDRNGEAACYGKLGIVFQSLDEYVKAEEYHHKALAIIKETGNRNGEAACCANLGTVYQSLSEYVKAEEYLEKALAIRKEIGDRNGEAACYGKLGNVFNSVGEHVKAEEYLEKALVIRKEIGDRNGEAICYGNLGVVFQYLGEHVKAEEYIQKALVISKEIGCRNGEAACYTNLGAVFNSLGEYERAEEYLKKAIASNKEIGRRKGEAACYGNLGNLFRSVGEYVKAEEYLKKALEIDKEIGDRDGESGSYGYLGALFRSVGEYEKAEEYLEIALVINKEIGNRTGEAACRGMLGAVFHYVGEYVKTEEYLEKELVIRKEIGDRNGEAECYGNLGINLFQSVGEYGKAEEYLGKALVMNKETGNKEGEVGSYLALGSLAFRLANYAQAKQFFEKALALSYDIGSLELQFLGHFHLSTVSLALQDDMQDVLHNLLSSMKRCEKIRSFLIEGDDQSKISFLDKHVSAYHLFSALSCHTGNHSEALFIAELGRSRALAEILSAQYAVEQQISVNPQSWAGIEETIAKENNCSCLYIAYYQYWLFLWIIKPKKNIFFRQKGQMNDLLSDGDGERFVNDVFAEATFRKFYVLPTQEQCEDRSLSVASQGSYQTCAPFQKGGTIVSRPVEEDEDGKQHPEPLTLSQCYQMIIAPVADLLDQPEIIIVPDRVLCKVPFAALTDESGKYLSETFRIRIVPSLTTLKLIQDSPADYHSQSGALIVGDPDVGHVSYKGSVQWIKALPCARREAEMIGKLVGAQPLLGENAAKKAVLHCIQSVSLIHFAAHGDAERGEIALAPARPFDGYPQEDDYLLTMADISRVRLRAKLVVLSCCHSAHGQIRSEGVVGIARAFLGSGARSVLVALWAIEDEATEQFMRRFYEHLVRGESASESLHQAMRWMRGNGFTNEGEWAPFMLIGDNVTFNFGN